MNSFFTFRSRILKYVLVSLIECQYDHVVAIDILTKFLLSFLALWLTLVSALISRRRKSNLRIAHYKSIINVFIIM